MIGWQTVAMKLRSLVALIAAVLVLIGLFYLVWRQGQAGPTGYLFGTRGADSEAGYCLAVAERAGEITRGTGDPRFEQHLGEAIAFWRGRVEGASGMGRTRLARDSNAPGVIEADLVRRAIGDCADRASRFYGHPFPSLKGL
jgi:hypothetical protein